MVASSGVKVSNGTTNNIQSNHTEYLAKLLLSSIDREVGFSCSLLFTEASYAEFDWFKKIWVYIRHTRYTALVSRSGKVLEEKMY